ncbi:hypothetical protein [Sporosarcina sp. FA9]|uniref:hypothetical protein n=1 Tax=Sporosarcina sp. FA9 TaxID=3413030 RepID=UPI003F660342
MYLKTLIGVLFIAFTTFVAPPVAIIWQNHRIKEGKLESELININEYIGLYTTYLMIVTPIFLAFVVLISNWIREENKNMRERNKQEQQSIEKVKHLFQYFVNIEAYRNIEILMKKYPCLLDFLNLQSQNEIINDYIIDTKGLYEDKEFNFVKTENSSFITDHSQMIVIFYSFLKRCENGLNIKLLDSEEAKLYLHYLNNMISYSGFDISGEG